MNFEFLPEADKEFREAARYYEEEALGVGMVFIAEVHRAMAWIARNPNASAKITNDIRKKVLKYFPFNLLYSIEGDLILIIAVAHQKRRPRYWRSRVKRLKEQRKKTIDSSGPGLPPEG
jgi:hypothetical protein